MADRNDHDESIAAQPSGVNVGVGEDGYTFSPTPEQPQERTPCTHPLNYYQEQHLAKIERTLRHALATRPTEHDSWLNAYQEDVRWLTNELKLRLP
jgi:hypothetical protein